MQLHHVLKAPVVSEKSIKAQNAGCYTFWVNPGSNKIEITQALKEFYGVDATQVRVVSVRKKVRMAGRRGRFITKRPDSKKAIITLAPKQKIDFNKFKSSK